MTTVGAPAPRTQGARVRARPERHVPPGNRVRVDGKFFSAGGERFPFRGVCYGTFAPRADGAQFPELPKLRKDLKLIRAHGFTVVRTYTLPPDDMVEMAEALGLRLLPDVFYPDWRYLVGGSRRQVREVHREAAREVRAAARRLHGNQAILGLSLGNEIPADVLRWHGANTVAEAIRELVDEVRDADPEQLVTYANYPTAEYLELDSLDFLTFNVFLESKADFRRYLTRLHHLAGDRPLVLGELGLNAGTEAESELRQAGTLNWQIKTAIERGVAGTSIFSWTDEWWVGGSEVEGWNFGLTRADRSPRPALSVARTWNHRGVEDLPFDWPRISAVICAHNAAATLGETLEHTCALEYPELEVIVVDDGSSDATAEIAKRFRQVRLIRIPHSGLSAARNEGLAAAEGDLVAYLDSDAYPTPEWPWYLALGLDGPDVGGAGGPNLPPDPDPPGAHVVARSPGGPVHVLIGDDRAEHIPGCNMAFWKMVLTEVGGLDPVYRVAGDDVDLCWRVQERGWEIGFHPAAVVWHHRRPGLQSYLRQQHEYGKAEALVEARHPNRFTPTGTARWRGRIYNSLTTRMRGQRIYRGEFGTAPFQSAYQSSSHTFDLVHQIGVPTACSLLVLAPLAALHPLLGLPAAAGLAFLLVLTLLDAIRIAPPRRPGQAGSAFRARAALHHILQPLPRAWGRSRNRKPARLSMGRSLSLPPRVNEASGVALLEEEENDRSRLTVAIVEELRRRGLRVLPANGWEDYDARVNVSPFAQADLQTSSYPEGYVQVRFRTRLRRNALAAITALIVAATVVMPPLAALAALPVAAVALGFARARRLPRQLFPRADG